MRTVQSRFVAAVLAGLTLSASPGYSRGSCPPCAPYSIAGIGGEPIVPGTADIGNHCDDCTTTVALPFPVQIYGLGPFAAANVSSNGTVQFLGSVSPSANSCLPSAAHDTTIFAYWDDLRTDAQPGCSAFPGATCGIFTSVSGVAPNRIFNIEWRAVHAVAPASTANFEVRLLEPAPFQDDFSIVFGALGAGGTSATAGVQCNTGSFFQQLSCNAAMGENIAFHYFCPFPVELTGFGVE
jgi:hypothetical protein